MITRSQVMDLREGDVVEVSGHPRQYGSTVRGPLRCVGGTLYVGDRVVRWPDGSPNATYGDCMTLTVVSRAPRPLYVNHPRSEPVNGDIVRDCDGDAWRFERDEWWCASADACDDDDPDGFPSDCYRPLTLLWDGATGQVVPS